MQLNAFPFRVNLCLSHIPICILGIFLFFSVHFGKYMDSSTPRGGFRFATNRKVELILQKELDDVAKKSITQINAFKEARKNAPLSEAATVSK